MSNSAGPGQAVAYRPPWRDHRPPWRIVNITPAERLGRITAGLTAIIAGIVLLTSAGSALAAVLEALLREA